MKFIYTIFIFLSIQNIGISQILFSFEIDATDPSMVEAKIYARASGDDENLAGYTSVFYFNSADVDWLSYDQAPAMALGWSTADFTARETSTTNVGVPIAHDTRLELQQFDGNFVGSTISSTAVHVGTLIFTATTASKGFLAPGDIFLSDASLDPGIQYVNNTFTGTNIATEGSTTQSLLPVDLISFTAQKQDEIHSLLSWETASEINNDFFEVQRSADAKNFEKIGKVQGSGTTEETQLYSFLDRATLADKNYYRLKQVDYNGEYEYSNIEVVDFSEDRGEITIFPNPTADYVNVTLDRQYEGIKVINNVGQTVAVVPATQLENSNIRIDVADYAPGVYVIEMKQGADVVNKQFVKVK